MEIIPYTNEGPRVYVAEWQLYLIQMKAPRVYVAEWQLYLIQMKAPECM